MPVIIILVVLLAAAGGGFWMLQNSRSGGGGSDPVATTPSPEITLPSPTTTSLQSSTALRKVATLEEFGDYQCPPCGNLHPIVTAIKKDYGERLRFVFHHFPLRQIHANAQAAAEAAVAAGNQNKFWEMHNLLYEDQSGWSEAPDMQPVITGFARAIGLDLNRFISDARSAATASTIATDIEQGMRLGVDSTPTIFINGEKIPYESYDAAGLRREIDRRISSN